METNSKYRSRKHCLLLYPLEDETHKKALEYIKTNNDYAMIVHDKDQNEDGELKKSHTHVVLTCSNAKWNTALAEELGITVNYIQKCRDFEGALDYLIHYNDDTKYQYSLDDVKGNLKNKLMKFINNDDKDENEKTLELITFIECFDGIISITEFARYVAKIGYWSVYRRALSSYHAMINEHNLKYTTSIHKL